VALSPSERSIRARIGALTLHSRYDSKELAAPAHRGFMARFEREVDPLEELSESERSRRAQSAMRAHMARLALASAKARRHRKAGSG
jgi:hypothetical protein